MPELGPHLLGRVPNKPDARDWSPERLHARIGAMHAPQSSGPIDFFLAIWHWLLSLLNPAPAPTPTPTPTGDGPLWIVGPVLDQGNYGTCVGNGWAGWGNATPVEDQYTETDARAIYYESTVIGGHPDDPDAPGGGQDGSEVRDGAKAMQKRGRLLAYAFTSDMAAVDEWLDNHGPVVIGVDWTADMFYPDADGTIHVTGPVEGGHCIYVGQNQRTKSRKRCRNSWGGDWGDGGDFYISDADLSLLLARQGDFCLAAEVPA